MVSSNFKIFYTRSNWDQIGFPFTCQKLNIVPYTLPDNEITGLKLQDIQYIVKQCFISKEIMANKGVNKTYYITYN